MAPFGISVIICTHNGAHRLFPTLDALDQQEIPGDFPWEILLVDNGSTDDTIAVAGSFMSHMKKDIPFRIINEPRMGKSFALIKGYDEAKYELMLVCDDDNWLQPLYLKTVSEIFREKPETGLLGGYGKAEFRGEEMPAWFEKWQQAFACGKHHEKSGYLSEGDYSIWGAGSVIRKTQWEFLRKCGFHFINHTGPGTAMGEDVELSHAVIYSGSKLYFDDRLWYRHDISRGRVTLKTIKKQVKTSGSTLFIIYSMAYKNAPGNKNNFIAPYLKWLIALVYLLLKQLLGKKNVLLRRHLIYQFYDLVTHRTKYQKVYYEIFPWITKVKERFPLKGTTL
ncbi:MAG TPA: glycosyltransferase [Bacteroidales bacterium]|nr:glycosyltransferase [Bacteroidales bacterium]